MPDEWMADRTVSFSVLIACLLVLVIVAQFAANHRTGEPRFRSEDRERLLARIGNLDDPAQPRPLVTLEAFFEGNNDPGSIGCNLPEPPHPQDFYAFLRNIRSRDDVSDVRIEVREVEGPHSWPFSDTVWIITTAQPSEVHSWFTENLAPDELLIGLDNGIEETEPYAVPEGMVAIGAWYD